MTEPIRPELARALSEQPNTRLDEALRSALAATDHLRHGHLQDWRRAVESLKDLAAEPGRLDTKAPELGMRVADQTQAVELLQSFIPWRKGPFRLAGVELDTEWRSDLKWQRLEPHLGDLRRQCVLDVGAGNGYFAIRLAAREAAAVVGIDPTALFVMQFRAIAALGLPLPVDVLPLAMEDLQAASECFDTCLSMGVLYHRRSPIEHLRELKFALKRGGHLLLETLIVAGDETTVLVPPGRYSRMRNVWFLPSIDALRNWLTKVGFVDIKLCDVSKTDPHEQRSTEWMPFESLDQALDPLAPEKTVEDLPAPRRALLSARRRA